MGITAKDVGIMFWKVLKFSVKTLYYCALKYPYISCILILFFLMYMFFPSVFTFLIYFSPLVVFAGVVHRVFLEIDRRKKVKISKENEKKNDGISSRNLEYVENELAVDKNGSFSVDTTTRRRNAKEGIKVDNAFSGVEDKDTVFSRSFNNDLVDKNALGEENPKEIREVKVDSSSRPETGDDSSEKYQKFTNGKSETERESADDTEDEDEDEEQEERNKAVEWTEDDQKNLMDLGLSEIERNKRLESLIARRRSRKYMSLQGRRTMGNAQISSIQIPKTNPFLVDSSGNQFSPVPGSAPSVLLPNSNPFDLPYDPFEEKPNLTGGSFQQEFMVPNQKDMMFCRHESFHMSAFLPPDSKKDNRTMHHDFFTKQRVFEKPPLATPVAAPMFKNDTDSSQGKEVGAVSEQVVDSVDHQNEDEESDVQTKEMVNDASSSDTNSSSSFEATEPIFRPNKEAILNSIRQLSRRNIVVDREVTCQTNNINESYDSGSSDFEKTKSDERFFHANMGMRHTPSHSIASDLQVEVSEVGSPHLTNISSQDEVSSTNDGDMEKEITSGSEEMWAASSHLSGVDENESRSLEVHEVNEQDVIEAGSSKVDPKLKSTPFASHVLPEKVFEQDKSDLHLLSPSKPELNKGIQHCKTNSNQSVIEKDLSSNASDSLEILSSEALAVTEAEKVHKSTGEFAATSSHYNDSIKPEVSQFLSNLNTKKDSPEVVYLRSLTKLWESSSPKKFVKELKTDSVSNPEVHENNDKEDSRTAVDVSSKSQTLIPDENKGNLSNLPNESSTMPTESEAQVENQLEDKNSIDSSKLHEEEDISTSLEYLEKGVQELAQHKDVFEKSEPTGDVEKQSQDREVDQSFDFTRGLVNSHASVSQNEVFTNQIFTTNLDKEMHKEIQTSDTDIGQSNNLDVEKPSQDREVDYGLSGPDLSGVSQDLINPPASVSQNEASTDQTSDIEIARRNNLDEQGSADGRDSHSSGDDMASAAVVVEQVAAPAPRLSSPKSVLQPTFSIDQAPSPNLGEEIHTEVPRSESGFGETDLLQQLQRDTSTPPATEDAVHLNDISEDGPSHEIDSVKLENSVHPLVTTPEEVHRTSINDSAAEEDKSKGDSQITSILEATSEILRPGNDTDYSKDTEAVIEKIAEDISPDHQSLPADQTRQEEQSNPPPEWSTEELTINPTAHDSISEMGENGSKSVAGDSECPSESITRQSSVHHFSRNSEDFIQDLFSSLVGQPASASANVNRQSSVHEFSRSSEDFLQDLFKSLVSDAGAASTRVSRQGSMLESSESTEDMIQDMFKSLQDNPRE